MQIKCLQIVLIPFKMILMYNFCRLTVPRERWPRIQILQFFFSFQTKLFSSNYRAKQLQKFQRVQKAVRQVTLKVKVTHILFLSVFITRAVRVIMNNS